MFSLPLLAAIISPFAWGFMNSLDKYVVAHKIKSTTSFAVLGATINLIFGIIIASLSNWQGIEAAQLIPSAIVGILWGVIFYAYYKVMSKMDASYMIGFVYLYPIIVAGLSFFILNERLSVAGYIGMIAIMMGILLLALRAREKKMGGGVWLIIIMIVLTALYEFLIKVSNIKLEWNNGLAVTLIFLGLTLMPLIFKKEVRMNLKKELKNAGYSLMNELLGLIGMLTTYYAMTNISATIFSSIAAGQPLTAMFFEKILHYKYGKMTMDEKLLPKLIAIILIITGVIILTLQ